MKQKKVLLIISILLASFSLSAITNYDQILTTTIMPDFALGTFPAGVNYEIGVSGLDFIPKQTTKLHAQFYSGLEVRQLTQYPTNGLLIGNTDEIDLKYYSFISEIDASFSQSFYRSSKYNNEFLTISIGAKMHWEQAFRVFNIFSDVENNSIFDNETFFPKQDAPYYGTPELNGNGQFLNNALTFGIHLSDIKTAVSYSDGYKFDINMVLSPWFLGNNLPWFKTFSDYLKFNMSGQYSFHFLKGEDFLGIDGSLTNLLEYQYLSGSAVPKYAQTMVFNGLGLAYYGQILMNNFTITFAHPKVFLNSNKLFLDFKWTEGIGYGTINNTLEKSLGFDHFGSVGVSLKAVIFNMLNAFVSCDYIYDNVKASANGWSFNFGVYFAYTV